MAGIAQSPPRLVDGAGLRGARASILTGMDLRELLNQPAFRRRDLQVAGMSARTIQRRIGSGLFVPVAPGVLAHRGLHETPDALDLAAHLSCGEPLTGPSAARLYPPGPVDELVTYSVPWLLTSRRLRLIAVLVPHPAPQTVLRKGLVVASPRQAALDCLRLLPAAQAQDLAFRCVQQGLLTAQDLAAEALTLRRFRGAPQLRGLAGMVGTNAHARSEELFHRKLRRAGLRDWIANLWVHTPVGQVCIDIAFREQMVAIEFDSPFTHASPARFRQDRRKWNALKRLGWEVLNYTWTSIIDSWQETLAEIRFFLSRH